MNMKWFIFNLLLLSGLTVATSDLHAQETKYDKRIHRYRKHWENLIPTHLKLQYAGNMGAVSVGTGWDYGKRNQWETDVYLGFLPKNSSKRAKMTMTLKQNYMPWSWSVNDKLSIEPLACGLYMNTIFGDEFWAEEPERYPNGYYGFSTKIRFHAYVGQRFTININPKQRFSAKEITFFYELSTSDLYIASAVGNSYLKPRDYLSLSFGVKLQLF